MIRVTDIRGKLIKLDSPASMIVSLVPSVTETVAYLAGESVVVGCTSYCELPRGLRERLSEKGGIVRGTKNPDIDLIKRLNPDVVFANREENRKADIEKIEKFTRVHLSEPRTVEDVLDLISQVGVILGTEKKAEEAVNGIKERLEKFAGLRGKKIRYAYLVWWNPPMVAGGDTYISNLLCAGSFENVFGDYERYPVVRIDELRESGVEIVFASSEPYDFNVDAIREVERILKGAEIRVMGIDGQMCGWHGIRTLHALDYLIDFISSLKAEAGS